MPLNRARAPGHYFLLMIATAGLPFKLSTNGNSPRWAERLDGVIQYLDTLGMPGRLLRTVCAALGALMTLSLGTIAPPTSLSCERKPVAT